MKINLYQGTIKKWMKKIQLGMGLVFANLFLAMPVFAEGKDPSAKTFTSWVLSDWVSPIFALIIVVLVIVEAKKQSWTQAILLIVGGAILYFFIKDPQAFLDSLSNIPTKFGF